MGIRDIVVMKIHLFVNEKKISKEKLANLEKKLLENKFEIVDEGYEVAIALGDDGAFLRMVKECNFNSNIVMLG